MVSSNFFKSNFIFSKDSKPCDYRLLSPFANMSGISEIDRYAITVMEKNIVKSFVSLPPVEQKIEMKDVAVFSGKSDRFINTLFCSIISENYSISSKNGYLKPSVN